MSCAGLMLLLATADDLRSKKVHNILVVIVFFFSFLLAFFIDGKMGLLEGSLSLLTATVVLLPFYLLKILGGGDVKLIAAISFLLTWESLLTMLFASLIWGALLGVFQVVLKGQGKAMMQNLLLIFLRQKPHQEQLHKIPYTVALFFGFLTSFSTNQLDFLWKT